MNSKVIDNVDVSVIIPVFDSASYLEGCLDSVLDQDFSGSKEIILVDDGSTDGSSLICDRYASAYDEIKVFHTENRGASLARAFGLENASGEYVTFVDSDDFVAASYVRKLYEGVVMTGESICACGILPSCEFEKCDWEKVTQGVKVLGFDEMMSRFFRYEFWGFVAKIYSRRVFNEIRFPAATVNEDYFVMARLFDKSRSLAVIPDSLYFFSRHEGSLSTTKTFSLRSFGEFENAEDVYEYSLTRFPRFSCLALSNAIGSAVKVLRTLDKSPSKDDYCAEKRRLVIFLRSHRFDLSECENLHWKTRLLAFCMSFESI